MSDPSKDSEQTHTPSEANPLITSSSAQQHCKTIAHVTALATWIDQKLPEVLHVALADGVAPADVAAAAGITVDALAQRWQEWSAQQTGTLTATEYHDVHTVLADAKRQA